MRFHRENLVLNGTGTQPPLGKLLIIGHNEVAAWRDSCSYLRGDIQKTKISCHILPAKTDHLDALPEIERAAAKIFPAEVLSSELSDQTTPLAAFDAAQECGMLWVAVMSDDHPVGFAIAEAHGPVLHLEELDVHPQFQGQGIGTALVAAICQFARDGDYQGISLTTFSQIPWNAPWYEKLGFQELDESELTEELKAILQDEAQRGLDPKSRVAMYMKI